MVEINYWRHFHIKKKRGRPKKRNGTNSKLLPKKNGDGDHDSDSVYKRRRRNIQPSKLGNHKNAGEYTESKIALMSNGRILRPREVHM